MYFQSFGLQRTPFGMTPDPGFLYLTAQHREALTGLAYAVLNRKGFVVLIGDAGTGKTTLLTRVLQHLPAERIQSSVILNPTVSPSEFLEMALLDFGISEIPASKAQRLQKLQQFLLKGHTAGMISTLVVDEAHKLTPELLEEIRLLSNFEDPNCKLLQILLIGQNELDDVLNRDDLRQLKQRIAMRLKIEPLSPEELPKYIQHRWSKAGGSTAPFPPEAIAAIAKYSRCIPRVINVLCDNALILALGKGETAVAAERIEEAAQDLHFTAAEAPAASRQIAPSAIQTATVPGSLDSPAAASAISFTPIRTLERYGDTPRPSLWARWAGRLGLA